MRIRIAASLCVFTCAIAHAATIGQIDTFSAGTANWIAPDAGNPNPPTTALGGPGGPTDRYLQLAANGGSGPGSRLTVLNGAQWTGNFISAGIGAIAMDVRNFGPSDLYLRLLFEHMTAPFTPPVDLALSTAAIFVPAGGAWEHIVFSIAPSSLTALAGTTEGALSATTTFRIFNNPNPSFGGPANGPPPVSVILGVDNIAAIPEPGTLLLVGAGVLAAILQRRAHGR